MTTLAIDANLIVLLVVGSYDIELVTKRRHKRCGAFDDRDFAILDDRLQRAEAVVCTPHALAEASNLIRLIGEPLRTELTRHLELFISGFREEFVPSAVAAKELAFPRLGLTDAGMLASDGNHEILTTDLDLFLAALSRGRRAINFAHLRDRA